MAKFLLSILLGLASLQAVTAAPAPEAVPRPTEFTPGPGLPSLAELNLTLADLDAMSPPSKEMRARAAAVFMTSTRPGGGGQGSCELPEVAYVDRAIVNRCVNYLRILPDKSCTVWNLAWVEQSLCHDGDATVTVSGPAKNGAREISCNDTATTVLAVMNQCTRKDQKVAGRHSLSNSKDLVIQVANWDYSFVNYVPGHVYA